ncbi:MAG: hypothetical protein P4L51_23670 [Puia sp.]|nr:hypothetical protein [Puia sp.]
MDIFREKSQVEEIRAFFKSLPVLPETLTLGPGEKVVDVPLFIQSSLAILEPGNSVAVQRPVWDRLVKARALLEHQQADE